jgi:hypothetical protein
MCVCVCVCVCVGKETHAEKLMPLLRAASAFTPDVSDVSEKEQLVTVSIDRREENERNTQSAWDVVRTLSIRTISFSFVNWAVECSCQLQKRHKAFFDRC